MNTKKEENVPAGKTLFWMPHFRWRRYRLKTKLNWVLRGGRRRRQVGRRQKASRRSDLKAWKWCERRPDSSEKPGTETTEEPEHPTAPKEKCKFEFKVFTLLSVGLSESAGNSLAWFKIPILSKVTTINRISKYIEIYIFRACVVQSVSKCCCSLIWFVEIKSVAPQSEVQSNGPGAVLVSIITGIGW